MDDWLGMLHWNQQADVSAGFGRLGMCAIFSKGKGCYSGNCNSQVHRICERSYASIIVESCEIVKCGIKIKEE